MEGVIFTARFSDSSLNFRTPCLVCLGVGSQGSAGKTTLKRLYEMCWNERRVYHFVYHRDRELQLDSVSTLSGQKQNPLI
jgi:hypothetical protein